MSNFRSRLRWLRGEIQAILDEGILRRGGELTRLHKVAHFFVLVWRSFERNRCPVRASSLAYATLLALVPMLAVVMSVTSTFLKETGEAQVDQFIMRMVSNLTPPDLAGTNQPAGQPATTNNPATIAEFGDTNAVPATSPSGTNDLALPAFAQSEDALHARERIAKSITESIRNTRSGTLGLTGTIGLIFVAILMLARVEDAFNDIWGVTRGRSWFLRIVLYWGVISLAPLLLTLALALVTGPHLASTKEFLSAMPFISNLAFQFLPIVVLVITFSLFYIAIPNTPVRWDAALVGGLTAGLLFHANNMVSVLYVSRVVSNSKIYGSIGLVLVVMIGLYFCWLILLLGAQVSYAYQNRATYVEEKQVENINQRGREFVALRLMTVVAERFARGVPPPTVAQLADQIAVPGRLIHQIMSTLMAAQLVNELAGTETAFAPARPIEQISCHDILQAMRATQGNELTTRDEPARAEVYGEFSRILEAERQVADSVSMLALVNRAHARELAAPTRAGH